MVTRNFHGRVPPKAAMSGVDDLELAESLNLDKGLSDMGLPLSKKELYERYGRSQPLDDDDALKPTVAAPGGGGFQSPKEGQESLPMDKPEFHDDPEMQTDWGYNNGMMGDAA